MSTRWPLRVYYEDTDASGVVYHARYLHYFERARTECLRSAGFSQQSLLEEHHIAFTIARIQVDYRAPARLDDQLEVRTTLHCRRALVEFEQQLVRMDTEELLARAWVKAGCVSVPQFVPVRIPPIIVQALRALPA